MKVKLRTPQSLPRPLLDISYSCETWMPHPKYKDYYGSSEGRLASVLMFSTIGLRVRVLAYKKILEITRGTRGRHYMRKQYAAHRFIWECFYGVVRDARQIVFIDGDPSNIRIENMVLVTPAKRCKLLKAVA